MEGVRESSPTWYDIRPPGFPRDSPSEDVSDTDAGV